MTWDTAESFPQNGEDGISNPCLIRRISPTVEPEIRPGTFSEYLEMHLPAQWQCQRFLVSMLNANVNQILVSSTSVNVDDSLFPMAMSMSTLVCRHTAGYFPADLMVKRDCDQR